MKYGLVVTALLLSSSAFAQDAPAPDVAPPAPAAMPEVAMPPPDIAPPMEMPPMDVSPPVPDIAASMPTLDSAPLAIEVPEAPAAAPSMPDIPTLDVASPPALEMPSPEPQIAAPALDAPPLDVGLKTFSPEHSGDHGDHGNGGDNGGTPELPSVDLSIDTTAIGKGGDAYAEGGDAHAVLKDVTVKPVQETTVLNNPENKNINHNEDKNINNVHIDDKDVTKVEIGGDKTKVEVGGDTTHVNTKTDVDVKTGDVKTGDVTVGDVKVGNVTQHQTVNLQQASGQRQESNVFQSIAPLLAIALMNRGGDRDGHRRDREKSTQQTDYCLLKDGRRYPINHKFCERPAPQKHARSVPRRVSKDEVPLTGPIGAPKKKSVPENKCKEGEGFADGHCYSTGP